MPNNGQNICSKKSLGIDFESVFQNQLPENESNLYWIVYNVVRQVVRKYQSAVKDENMAIDVQKLAEYLDIKVVYRSIAVRENLFQDEVAGFIDKFNFGMGNDSCIIYVNENLGELSRRYVVGHEIGHFILNNGQQSNKVEYCRNVMLPRNIKERVCNLLASFIFMPIESVMKLMDEFCDERRKSGAVPIDPDEWLQYLGYKFKLSNYHTILCFQDIRNLAGVLYSMGFFDKADEEHMFEDEEVNQNLSRYEKLFR